MPCAAQDFDYVEKTGLFDTLIDDHRLVRFEKVTPAVLGAMDHEVSYVLEHPKLPFIAYPYEWPFEVLRCAAVFHLDLHLYTLDHNVTLTDASAYNVQFQGVHPIFIDHLSFRRYQDGEYWDGYRQFCQQFVNPLLLRASVGVPHNAWYRGSLEGITPEDLTRILPLRRKLSWNVLLHVVAQAAFQAKAARSGGLTVKRKANLPKQALIRMLAGLRKWNAKLSPSDTGKTIWRDYAQSHSYTLEEYDRKKALIAEFCGTVRPRLLWDFGCNTGDFAKVALAAGTESVVGFDVDQQALDLGFIRAQRENLNFLPLVLDLANPSPNQGWAEAERAGIGKRRSADGLIALALIHHLELVEIFRYHAL